MNIFSFIRCLPLIFASTFVFQVLNAQNGVGIGITTPAALLHVRAADSGAIPSPLAGVILESDTHIGINLLTPNNAESGIYFGNALNSAHGAIVYNSPTTNGLAFRTNGNVTRMVLTDIGNVGIGVINPSDKLHINTLSGDALRVQINGSTKFRVMSNGGTSIGSAFVPVANGLRVHGPLEPAGGIRSTIDPILIESTVDSIEIKAGASRIVVHSNGSIKILAAGGNDITIDAGTGDLILKGHKVDMSATTDIDIAALSHMDVQAGLTMDVLGNIVRLNGGTTPVAKQLSVVTVSGATGVVSGNVSPTVFTQ